MKKTIITIIVLIFVLAAVAGALTLINKLFYAADRDVVVASDFVSLTDTVKTVSVAVDIGYVNVSERPSGETVTFEFAAPKDEFYSVTVSSDTISVNSEELKWYDRARYSTADKYGVTIGIPADFDGDITVITKAGSITLSDITAGSITAKTDAGNVGAKNVISSGALTMDAGAGNISLDSVNAVDIDASTYTGNIEFTRIISDGLCSASFVTKVGNIDGEFDYPREHYKISLNVGTGNTNVREGGDGIEITLSSDVGNVNVNFK